MLSGDEETFRELLQKSSPRNISPAPPNFNEKIDQHMKASELQHHFFLNEVRQHAELPAIRSYLKLYSSVDVAKLADFCQVCDSPETEIGIAVCFQYALPWLSNLKPAVTSVHADFERRIPMQTTCAEAQV